ncbi:MAG: ComEA family DNA-binding protein [Coriobacteriia bacterium]|nr:ComEA family DNA-binding protein [Coriobacteriia bacterium]
MRQELREWIEELACRAGLDGLPPFARKAALIAGFALVALAVWWWGRPAAPVTPVRTAQEASASGEATVEADPGQPSLPTSVTVHVVGAVMRPGVYTLSTGSRASDAVAAAGGLLGNAEQGGINLARQVADGEQLVVPVQGAAQISPAGGSTGAGATPTGGSVDLNTASATELDTLPGVGPATAAKIIADRTANGPFRSIEDLMRVPGIGPTRFESLKGLVVVR